MKTKLICASLAVFGAFQLASAQATTPPEPKAIWGWSCQEDFNKRQDPWYVDFDMTRLSDGSTAITGIDVGRVFNDSEQMEAEPYTISSAENPVMTPMRRKTSKLDYLAMPLARKTSVRYVKRESKSKYFVAIPKEGFRADSASLSVEIWRQDKLNRIYSSVFSCEKK
jgi:hypothetical protein